jgi:hypothetical protein
MFSLAWIERGMTIDLNATPDFALDWFTKWAEQKIEEEEFRHQGK